MNRDVYVKVGTMPGDRMRLMRLRKLPKPGQKFYLRHTGPYDYGKKDLWVYLIRINEDGRLIVGLV